MPLRNLVPAPRAWRALVVALTIAACTDAGLPTAPTSPAPPARPSLDAIVGTANPSLIVVPATAYISQGRGIPLAAVIADPLNAAQATAPIVWSSSNPGIATVSATGHVLGVTPGMATITASAMGGGIIGTSAVRVMTPPNCRFPTPRPRNLTGVLTPVSPTYEDTPVVFRLTIDDPDPCHKYTFRLLDNPIMSVMYQVADDGTPQLDAPLSAGMTVTNAEGWVAFYPRPGFFGHDSFRYDVRDEGGRGYGFHTPFPIQVLPVNDPPIATPTTHVGDNNYAVTNVLLRATDIDNLVPDKCIAELPQNGDLYWSTVAPANRVVAGDCRPVSSLRYVSRINGVFGCGPLPPRSTYPHADTFRWYATDGRAASDTVSGTIRIDYVNHPPVYSGPASASTTEDTPGSFTLTGADPDGNAFAYQINSLPRHGSLWVLDPGSAPRQITIVPAMLLAAGDGTRSLQYVPNADFNTLTQGDDFQFFLTDGDLLPTCDHSISFDVAPGNDAPTILAPDRIGAIVALGGIGVPSGFSLSVADDARPTDVLEITLRAQGAAAARVDFIDPTGFTVRRVSATEVVFEGTFAAINTLLGRGVQWTPNGSGANYGELAIIVDDRGNFGAGGARVGTKIIAVDVGFETEGLEGLRTAAPTIPSAPTRRRPTPDRR